MLPLIITVIIDVMGNNIILPLLPALLIEAHVSLLPVTMSESARYVLYGLCVALWPLGIFFGTPYLSGLSDSQGRKPILILALLGTACAFVLSAFSILIGSFVLFALCRFINGFFSGTFSVAQASITHNSQNYQEKIRKLGWLSFAGTVGAVIGPLLSGVLVGHNPEKWQFALPFMIATVLALCNIGLLYINFKEPKSQNKISENFKLNTFAKGIYTNVKFIFVDPRIRIYMILFCLLQIGWGAFIQGLPLFLQAHFNLSTPGISLVFTSLAISLGIAQVSIRPILTKYLPPIQMFIVSACLLGIFAIMLSLTQHLVFAYLWAGLSVIAEMLAYTGIISLFSDAVTPEEQGKVMGGTAAIFGLAWMLSGVCIGPLAAYSVLLPIAFCGVFTLVAGLILIRRLRLA